MIKLSADSVQGVAYLQPGQQVGDALKVWDTLFPGDSPDGFQKGAGGPALLSSASGERDGVVTSVTARVGRIDVVLNSPMTSLLGSLPGGIPRIANFEDAATRVSDHLRKLMAFVDPTRLALVIDGSVNVDSASEPDVWRDLLPSVKFPPQALDQLHQYNLPVQFECNPKLKMNRLCTWSAANLTIQASGPGVALNSQQVFVTRVVSLKVDVNTASDQYVGQEQAPAVIAELLSACVGVANGGFRNLGYA